VQIVGPKIEISKQIILKLIRNRITSITFGVLKSVHNFVHCAKCIKKIFCLLHGIFYCGSVPSGSVSRLFNIVSTAAEVASKSNRTYFVIREEQILTP